MTLDELRSRTTITVPELAEVLGVGHNAAYEAVNRGQVPALRISGRWVCPVPALLQFLGEPHQETDSAIESDKLRIVGS